MHKEDYKNALNIINDLVSIEENIDLLVSSKSDEEFEGKVRELMNSVKTIQIRGEFFDNQDYTKTYLMVHMGVNIVDFPEIETKIAYEYGFKRGFKMNCAYSIVYKQEELTAKEAKAIFEKLIQ